MTSMWSSPSRRLSNRRPPRCPAAAIMNLRLKTSSSAPPTSLPTQPRRPLRRIHPALITHCSSGAVRAWAKRTFSAPSSLKSIKISRIITSYTWTVKNLPTRSSAPSTTTPRRNFTTNTARPTCCWWTISSSSAARNPRRRNFSTPSTRCITLASRSCLSATVPQRRSKAWRSACAPVSKWA